MTETAYLPVQRTSITREDGKAFIFRCKTCSQVICGYEENELNANRDSVIARLNREAEIHAEQHPDCLVEKTTQQ